MKTTKPDGDFCLLARPHYLKAKTVQVMSDEEVEQELQHNELGEKLCGWKPSRN